MTQVASSLVFHYGSGGLHGQAGISGVEVDFRTVPLLMLQLTRIHQGPLCQAPETESDRRVIP